MTFVSTIAQSQGQISRLQDLQLQLGTLQQQISSGKTATTIAGLGSNAPSDLRTRGSLTLISSYIQNITVSGTRIAQQVQGLQGIQSQAQQVLDSLNGQMQQGSIDLTTIRRLASNAYDYITSTLNMQDGNTYVFAGTDSSTPPFTDQGTLDSFYSNLNSQWSAGTLAVTPPNTDIADQYISEYSNIPQVTQGFSASLGNAQPVYVKADDQVNINTTVMANDPAMQKIVSILGALKNISDLNNAPGATTADKTANFYKVYNNMSSQLHTAIGQVTDLSNNLATAQAQLTTIKDNHTTEQNTLENTVSNIENVDLNEAAVKVQALGTQLQASYQVTSLLSKLTLSNFI